VPKQKAGLSLSNLVVELGGAQDLKRLITGTAIERTKGGVNESCDRFLPSNHRGTL
jgi:hypothetical protein